MYLGRRAVTAVQYRQDASTAILIATRDALFRYTVQSALKPQQRRETRRYDARLVRSTGTTHTMDTKRKPRLLLVSIVALKPRPDVFFTHPGSNSSDRGEAAGNVM